MPLSIDSGSLPPGRGWATVVTVPGAAWVRLHFAAVDLPPGAVLRLESLADGAVQVMDAAALERWGDSSAYFNGAQVRVEFVPGGGIGSGRVILGEAEASMPDGGGAASICGTFDNRAPIDDARVARLLPAGCTAWIVDDVAGCLVGAGHCGPGAGTVVEFNVPPSLPGGQIVHPPPADQYVVDPASVQALDEPTGDDWAYFGCLPNETTGLSPRAAQGGAAFILEHPPAPAGQPVRVSGYGVDNQATLNGTLQSHVGPYTMQFGFVLRHEVDTEAGNSGSPMIDEGTGRVFGIHNSGGCGRFSGTNGGTGVNSATLEAALIAGRGVCAGTTCPGDVRIPPNGTVDVLDLTALILRWGDANAHHDIDGDGTVGVGDLVMLIDAWGACE